MSAEEPATTPHVEPASPLSRNVRRVVEWTAVLVAVFVASFLIRAYAFQVFEVPSGSMLPTLQIGDRLVVNKLPGLADDIHRGDIVVFRRAPGDLDTQYPILVKRVIGLPGETISSKGDTIYVNGRAIAEPWLSAMDTTVSCSQSNFAIPTTHIASGQYYVMGDCRGNSSDSRVWGTVPVDHIIGRVFLVLWRHNHPWFHWF
jgi:signal peptidase I